ncbi:hypothetical protein I3842_01G305800 [Carya illinoinensis]|uniref:Uncharacterized protein n=1 Tax=Carya illinoinensis TaxID=32201 RepID=A0A922GC45_CARIL|nr:hypothetical protein I3842_01G305800 [Carya illinoinensis]
MGFPVVENGFRVPYEVELTVKKKHHGLFAALDGSCSNFQKKRVLRDSIAILSSQSARRLISTLCVLTPHHRWIVHRGESSEREDLLSSVQRSNLIPMTQLHVFLASNIDKDICNFQVVGCCSSRSLRVYRGDTVIAELTHNFKRGSCCRSKECFRIKLYPGADDAFVVALSVILRRMPRTSLCVN